MKMNEVFESGLALLMAMLCGFFLGSFVTERTTRKIMAKVGIVDVRQCENSYSNWYEIVWSEDKKLNK